MNIYWHLPILIIVVSIVYSATRYDRLEMILREAVRWGMRMAVFLFMIGAALFVLSTFI